MEQVNIPACSLFVCLLLCSFCSPWVFLSFFISLYFNLLFFSPSLSLFHCYLWCKHFVLLTWKDLLVVTSSALLSCINRFWAGGACLSTRQSFCKFCKYQLKGQCLAEPKCLHGRQCIPYLYLLIGSNFSSCACVGLLTSVSLQQAVGAPKILRVFYHRDLGHANDDSIRTHFWGRGSVAAIGDMMKRRSWVVIIADHWRRSWGSKNKSHCHTEEWNHLIVLELRWVGGVGGFATHTDWGPQLKIDTKN